MTMRDLIIKLEECRSACEGSKDDRVNDAFYTLNELISDIENDGLSGDEFFSSGRNRGRWQE